MSTVALETAQKQLHQLVESVKHGEHVVITQNDQPVAELVPVSNGNAQPHFGSAKGLLHMADDFDAPLIDFADYVK